jgi:hypothetical protein
VIGLVVSGIAMLFDYGTFPSQADVKFRSIGKHGTLNSSPAADPHTGSRQPQPTSIFGTRTAAPVAGLAAIKFRESDGASIASYAD